MDVGIRPDEFWELSLLEIYDITRSYSRIHERERKEAIGDYFVLAQIISRCVWADKKAKVPTPWEYYPDLYSDDKEEFEEAQRKAELEEYKAKREAYINEFNKRFVTEKADGEQEESRDS